MFEIVHTKKIKFCRSTDEGATFALDLIGLVQHMSKGEGLMEEMRRPRHARVKNT